VLGTTIWTARHIDASCMIARQIKSFHPPVNLFLLVPLLCVVALMLFVSPEKAPSRPEFDATDDWGQVCRVPSQVTVHRHNEADTVSR
jgi:hypothetical protein